MALDLEARTIYSNFAPTRVMAANTYRGKLAPN